VDKAAPWVAMVLVIVATIFNSFGLDSRLLFLLACLMWSYVGIIWKQPSLWILNLFCSAIYAIGFLK
jgi:hypothetical protein